MKNPLPVTKGQARFFSPGILFLALICMALPFVSISCGAQDLGTYSGFELLAGNDVGGEDVSGFFSATLLLITLAVGIGIAFWKDSKNTLVSLGVIGFGLLMLITLAFSISGRVAEANRELGAGIMVESSLRAGWYLVFLLLLLAAAANVYLMMFFPKED